MLVPKIRQLNNNFISIWLKMPVNEAIGNYSLDSLMRTLIVVVSYLSKNFLRQIILQRYNKIFTYQNFGATK